MGEICFYLGKVINRLFVILCGKYNSNYACGSAEDLPLLRHPFSCHCFLSSVGNVLVAYLKANFADPDLDLWLICFVISSCAPHRYESESCSRNEIKMLKDWVKLIEEIEHGNGIQVLYKSRVERCTKKNQLRLSILCFSVKCQFAEKNILLYFDRQSQSCSQ